MSDSVKNCNFSFICNLENCDRKHFIEDINDRKIFKDLYDANYDEKKHSESDHNGVRNMSCYYGLICSNSECNLKHYCNYEFRMNIITRKWNKYNKNKFYIIQK